MKEPRVLRPKNIVAPDGWIALADVSHRIFVSFMNNIQTKIDNPFYSSNLPPTVDSVGRQYAMFWKLLKLIEKVALLSPDGTFEKVNKKHIVLRPDHGGMEEIENWSYENEVFNLHDCTVGSGSKKENCQPYHGCNILVDVQEVERAFRNLGLAPRSTRGAPIKKRRNAEIAYSSLYPNGHEVTKDPWGVVLENVIKLTGQEVSLPTLKRAIGLRK